MGFNARESITLHDIRYSNRPVCYRASLAEMVVPYGSPDNAHFRKNVFDVGEYGLEYEVKATGIINTVGCAPGAAQKYGTEVAPGVVGQIHQHLFCARLDMAVDGDRNSVLECNTRAEPAGPNNPYGNAFYVEETPLQVECGRTRNPDTERYWKFVSAERRNAMGRPTGYKLEPRDSVAAFVHPDSPSGRRMPFVRNHLWLTQHHPDERYPAGEYVNHCDGSDGVHAYAAKQRSVRDADVVAWHVFGIHHLPRPEDYPVQPVVSTGFKLMPNGFFDCNPTLDLPAERNAASCRAQASE